MQETDFPATDTFAPIDPPILLGFDPVFLSALLLVLAAIALGMFLLGRWHAGRSDSGSDDAPAQIHAAILTSSRAAMAADSNDLRGRVQTLRDLIEQLLGPVLALNRGLYGALKDMDVAFKGEIKDAHGAGHGGAAHGDHGSSHHTPAPRHDQTSSPIPGSGGGAAASSAIAVIGHPIHIHTSPAPVPAPSHDPSHGEPRKMSHDEQTSALALSVRRFNDHWSKTDLRIRELRAARAALSRRPPAGVVKASDTRVWEKH